MDERDACSPIISCGSPSTTTVTSEPPASATALSNSAFSSKFAGRTGVLPGNIANGDGNFRFGSTTPGANCTFADEPALARMPARIVTVSSSVKLKLHGPRVSRWLSASGPTTAIDFRSPLAAARRLRS